MPDYIADKFNNITEYPNTFKRQGAFPLDAFSVFKSKAELENYVNENPVAYVGQIVVSEEDTTVNAYIIADETGLLIKLASVNVTDNLTSAVTLLQTNVNSLIEKIKNINNIYIGSGEMPEDYNVQIDPEGEIFDFDILNENITNTYATKQEIKKITEYKPLPVKIGTWIDGRPIYRMYFDIKYADLSIYVINNTFVVSMALILMYLNNGLAGLEVTQLFSNSFLNDENMLGNIIIHDCKACISKSNEHSLLNDIPLITSGKYNLTCDLSYIDKTIHDSIYGFIELVLPEDALNEFDINYIGESNKFNFINESHINRTVKIGETYSVTIQSSLEDVPISNITVMSGNIDITSQCVIFDVDKSIANINIDQISNDITITLD